jgi:hypothetical protein
LAEADLRLEYAFSAKKRPDVTQRITGPIDLDSAFLMVKPTEEKIKPLAQRIHDVYHPKLEELHWLIAERTLLYEKILKEKG